MLTYAALLIVLIALSAFFSAAETALFSLTPAKVRALLQSNVKGAKQCSYLRANPKKTLATILVGNNVVNILASSLATLLAIRAFGDVGAGLAAGAMVVLILIFGEVTPKSYAAHHAETFALFAAPLLAFLMKLLYPAIVVLEFIARKLTKTEAGMKSPKVTEEELKAMLEMSAESGSVEKEEKEMIESVLKFSDITVREVMTHRSEMISIEAGVRLKDAARIMESENFSRYPVYKQAKENIIGIVHIKDVFSALTKGEGDNAVESIITSVYFVPQHMLLNHLLKEFQEKQLHMAVVVNDHGEIIGLVTLEDLLEELVGEIIDESDVKQRLIKRVDKQTILAHGATDLQALNRFFHTNLPGSPHDTLSRIILKSLKRFPQVGEMLNINQNEITIVEATPRKIIKVQMKKLYE
ncbi:MAG: hemolysin family protein [Nanoarchaeota archaeon]|nr:hemolysin family protein [Nanoarchaeota archaeon]